MKSYDNSLENLPVGIAPAPVATPHFPDTLHATVWRNWDVVDAPRLAEVLEATPEQLTEIAASMGLPPQRQITRDEQRRNYMTILRRNWHLLPYDQLCQLLGWDAGQMLYSLNEDDFMWVKLGGYKPRCSRVIYQPPNNAMREHATTIKQILDRELGSALSEASEPPYGFIARFNTAAADAADRRDRSSLQMVYPYFLRFGDPLFGDGIDDIPDGYLAALSNGGVNAIWLQALLNKLAPWSLASELSQGWEERLTNLNRLVARCRKYGIDVLLYLNEPRAMPRSFFQRHPELRGVEETPSRAAISPDVMALCTSTPVVQEFLVNATRHVFERVPDLGGVFTITFSENLTNCHSRIYDENECPRCKARGPEAINAEVNALIERGMRQAGSKGRMIWYVWSTPKEWIDGIIARLPASAEVLSVSEWGTPFTRGDYSGKVNEYSISVVGPSDESRRQWKLARDRGLKAIAKIQAANSWELSSVPYVPALRLVGEHIANLCDAGVDGLMLGWSLGGSPSPNLEIAARLTGPTGQRPTVQQAMRAVAARRFGDAAASGVVEAWNLLSDAFAEFPFDIHTAYSGPQNLGPANPLFDKPSGFTATMITFAFDDLKNWRGPYSPETFQRQWEKLAALWQKGVDVLDRVQRSHPSRAIEDEWRIAQVCQLHFASSANQVRFIRLRETDSAAAADIARSEIELAKRLLKLLAQDSRIGFEATNQYAYVRLDLVEKILNCHDIISRLNNRK